MSIFALQLQWLHWLRYEQAGCWQCIASFSKLGHGQPEAAQTKVTHLAFSKSSVSWTQIYMSECMWRMLGAVHKLCHVSPTIQICSNWVHFHRDSISNPTLAWLLWVPYCLLWVIGRSDPTHPPSQIESCTCASNSDAASLKEQCHISKQMCTFNSSRYMEVSGRLTKRGRFCHS